MCVAAASDENDNASYSESAKETVEELNHDVVSVASKQGPPYPPMVRYLLGCPYPRPSVPDTFFDMQVEGKPLAKVSRPTFVSVHCLVLCKRSLCV